MSPPACRRYLVSGRVQGVFFRGATREQALALGLCGRATNLSDGRVEVIAGLNLPMLIKLASLRESEPLQKAVTEAQDAGRKYINVASQLLSEDKGR